MKHSDKTYPHGKLLGVLIKTLWGGKSADYFYVTVLLEFLGKSGYNQTQSDGCVISKRSCINLTEVAVTVDDFLVTENATKLIDDFYSLMTRKYTIKRLGRP